MVGRQGSELLGTEFVVDSMPDIACIRWRTPRGKFFTLTVYKPANLASNVRRRSITACGIAKTLGGDSLPTEKLFWDRYNILRERMDELV